MMFIVHALVPQPESSRRLTRRLAWLATSLSLAALLSVPNVAAAAGRTFEASGTFAQTSFEVSNVRSAGGVTLFDFTETDDLFGTFSGTDVVEGSCAMQSSGKGECHAIETFSGTVNGVYGELQFSDVFFLDPTGSFRGPFTIIGGTGGLANLHGHGTFEGTTTGTYEGRLVFAP
jgi:hypothetical protein